MKLLVIRHGETDYNIDYRICGVSPAMLTDLGKQQALETSKEIKDIDIAAIYVSPLQRAIDTANIINQYDIPMYIDDRLHEINFGIFEGESRNNEDFKKVKYQLGMRYPQGETFLEVVHRVYSFLDEMKIKHKDQTILVVCHGGVIRAIHSYVNEMNYDDFYRFTTPNCKLIKYEL